MALLLFLTMNSRGFTLLELILYVSMASLLLGATTLFFTLFLDSKARATAATEVAVQGTTAMEHIGRLIRSSNSITLGAGTACSSSVRRVFLGTDDPATNPTTIELDPATCALYIKEGTQKGWPITNELVSVSGFAVSILGSPQASARVQFTLTAKNPGGRGDGTYIRSFVETSTRREP